MVPANITLTLNLVGRPSPLEGAGNSSLFSSSVGHCSAKQSYRQGGEH